MTLSSDEAASTAQLLVSIASVAGVPGASLVDAALSGTLSARELFRLRAPKPDLEEKVATALQTAFVTLDFADGVGDADKLLPQMVIYGLPELRDLLDGDWTAPTVAKAMRDIVQRCATDPEHKAPSVLASFEIWIAAGLEPLLNDSNFVKNQAPVIVRDLYNRISKIERDLDDLRRQPGGLGAAIEQLAFATQDQLVAIAASFEIERVYERSAADLRDQLRLRAEDYRRYRTEIDAIDERIAGLGNLKVAAKDAAARLDFEEVETLLARVDEVETEIATQTKELRADNALLRGRVEETYRLLLAAAESFASVEQLEPVRRKWRYGERFFRYGKKFGGTAFDAQRRLLTSALGGFSEAQDPILFAECNFALALSLKEEARRLGGKSSVEFIEQSISHCLVALRIFRTEGSSTNLARALDLLGNAKTVRASDLYGPAREREFKEAIDVYREALELKTDRKSRAKTQGNLGGALVEYGYPKSNPLAEQIFVEAFGFLEQTSQVFYELGELKGYGNAQLNLGRIHQSRSDRVTGVKALELLDRAERAYREALTSFPEDDNPIRWAAIQFNLGIVFHRKTEQMNDARIVDVFAQGEAAYRAALRIRLERDMEAPVAKTRFHIGALLSERARRTRGEDRERLFDTALEEYSEALRFYSKPNDPVMWAETQQNIAVTLDNRTSNSECPELSTKLRDGLKAINAALEVYDPENMPEHFREATETKTRLEAKLARLEGGSD